MAFPKCKHMSQQSATTALEKRPGVKSSTGSSGYMRPEGLEPPTF
jgi:hypothetical protein